MTRNTLYKVLGFGTLKDSQEHFDKVFHGKQKPFSVELPNRFASRVLQTSFSKEYLNFDNMSLLNSIQILII